MFIILSVKLATENFLIQAMNFYLIKKIMKKIKGICWWEDSKGYVRGKIKNNGKAIFLHHLVFEYNDIIDHRNRNRLDCRKENLVPSTDMDNRQNSTLQKSNKTGCVGVKWHSLSNKWSADITYHRKRIHLGTFDNIEGNKRTGEGTCSGRYFGSFN